MTIERLNNIRLINADCMDVLRELPDNAFDLAIVDPPYSSAGGNVERTGGSWALSETWDRERKRSSWIAVRIST